MRDKLYSINDQKWRTYEDKFVVNIEGNGVT